MRTAAAPGCGCRDNTEAGDDRNACGDYVYEKDGLRLILSGGVGVGRGNPVRFELRSGKSCH